MTNPVPLLVTQPDSWQTALREAITDPRELLRALELDPGLLPDAVDGGASFPLRVPRGFVARMRSGDPNDPLLRQVLPLGGEAAETPGFLKDPVGDAASVQVPGLLHKYRHRVLLITTGACAVHCRYCFRRHFPYAESHAARSDWRPAIDYIQADTSINEAILSGGDPLMLATGKLKRLVGALARIPHLRRLRIHSRVPVVLPERVDAELLAWLEEVELQKVLVIHANHPSELDDSVDRAMGLLGSVGVCLFNQSVLLAGVNDCVDTLGHLSERLFSAGVIPYYLHLLDRVQGAAHFEVSEARARDLYRSLRARQSGYLVPRLVREVAGEPYKTPLL